MPNNSDITRSFVDAWASKDIDTIMEFFTEDAVYINIPMDPPNRGKTDIRNFIEGFIGMATEIEFVIHHQLEGPDGVVMNERTDRFKMDGKWVELPVMGAFVLRDGGIAEWRDYFDMNQFQSQLPG